MTQQKSNNEFEVKWKKKALKKNSRRDPGGYIHSKVNSPKIVGLLVDLTIIVIFFITF